MDLLKLNEEICSMRPAARQAKVHVIHSLTRNARNFELKKGGDTMVAKNKRKAKKLKEEALIDGVLTPDEIIKFSLQFDSGLRDKVLDDVEIPLSAKAFARIASYEAMVQAVENFRRKYPDWHKHLEKSLEKLGTGARFCAKMKNGRVKAHLTRRRRVEEAVDTIRRAQMSWLHRSTKVKNKSGDKSRNNKDLESGNGNGTPVETSVNAKDDDGNKSKSSESKHGALHYEEVDEEETSDEGMGEEESDGSSEGEDEDEDKKIESEEIEDRVESDGELKKKTEVARNENKFSRDKKLKEENKQLSESGKHRDAESHDENDTGIFNNTARRSLNRKANKNAPVPRSREAEVCRFADLLHKQEQTKHNENTSRADNSSESENESDSSVKSEDKGVDPFFVTKNKDFLRIATAKREEETQVVREGPKWGVEGCEDWTGTRRERRARALGRPQPRPLSKKFHQRAAFSDSSPNPTRNIGNLDAPVQAAKRIPQDEPEKLHPSWEAKRKMQTTLTGFQGKKVKFDDSD